MLAWTRLRRTNTFQLSRRFCVSHKYVHKFQYALSAWIFFLSQKKTFFPLNLVFNKNLIHHDGSCCYVKADNHKTKPFLTEDASSRLNKFFNIPKSTACHCASKRRRTILFMSWMTFKRQRRRESLKWITKSSKWRSKKLFPFWSFNFNFFLFCFLGFKRKFPFQLSPFWRNLIKGNEILSSFSWQFAEMFSEFYGHNYEPWKVWKFRRVFKVSNYATDKLSNDQTYRVSNYAKDKLSSDQTYRVSNYAKDTLSNNATVKLKLENKPSIKRKSLKFSKKQISIICSSKPPTKRNFVRIYF